MKHLTPPFCCPILLDWAVGNDTHFAVKRNWWRANSVEVACWPETGWKSLLLQFGIGLCFLFKRSRMVGTGKWWSRLVLRVKYWSATWLDTFVLLQYSFVVVGSTLFVGIPGMRRNRGSRRSRYGQARTTERWAASWLFPVRLENETGSWGGRSFAADALLFGLVQMFASARWKGRKGVVRTDRV
jgi:hypothetical protein